MGGEGGAETLGGGGQIGAGIEGVEAILEVAGDVIETNPAQANRGLFFLVGGGDDDDGCAIEHGARPGGELADEADVDAAGEMAGGEFGGVSGIEDLRAAGLQLQDLVKGQRIHFVRQGLVQRRMLVAVEHGIVIEVGRSIRLVGGDDLDEGFSGQVGRKA